jgi:hypothetical protein
MSEKSSPLKTRSDPRILISLLLAIILIANWIPQIDSRAQSYLTDTIASNAAVFGIVRSLNAAISVVQTAEVGVGIASIGPGEALDPVNDLVERFSGILLFTLTALGIAQVFLLFTTSMAMKIVFSAVVGVAVLNLWWSDNAAAIIMRVLLALLILRFVFVAQVWLVYLFDWMYFNATGTEAMSVLEGITRTFESMRESFSNLNIRERLFGDNQSLVEEDTVSETIASNVITLIVGMLFKSVIIPIGTLWIGLKMVASVFTTPATSLLAFKR